MTTNIWIGSDGDWNDPTNWSLGVVPTTDESVVFQSEASATIEGSAYIGNLLIGESDVTISGDLASDGINPSSIADQAQTLAGETLTIDSWGQLSLTTLSLTSTTLDDLGLLITNAATIAGGLVSGPYAEWFSAGTTIEGTLNVNEGAVLEGNFTLANGSSLSLDALSSVAGGTITIQEDSAATLGGAVGSSGSSSASVIDDDISLSDGSLLTIGAAGSSSVEIDGDISGNGTIILANVSLGVMFTNSVGSDVGTAADGSSSASPAFDVSSAELNLSLQAADGSGPDLVYCSGSSDSLVGGARSFDLLGMGASSMSVVGGAGANTVSAGTSILDYQQGSGAASISCGSSGADVVDVGTGASTVDATNGAKISVAGNASTSIAGAVGAFSVNAMDAMGDTYVSDTSSNGTVSVVAGLGTLTVQGGAGSVSVQGASGDLSVFDGTGSGGSVHGGFNNNTIILGSDGYVLGVGGGTDIFGVTGPGSTIDASGCTGNDTIFSNSSSGTTSVTTGSGSTTVLGGSGALDVQCGNGANNIFAGSGFGDTLIGGTAADVLQGGPGASIETFGGGADTILASGQGTLIDATQSTGKAIVFAQGSGTTSIVGGTGQVLTVFQDTTVALHSDVANGVSFCGENSDLVLSGAAAETVVCGGDNDTIDASGSSGDVTYFLSGGPASVSSGAGSNLIIGGSSAATINASLGSTTIFGGSGSMLVNISEASGQDSGNSLIFSGFSATIDQVEFSAGGLVQSMETPYGLDLIDGQQSVLLYQYFGPSPTNV